MQALFLRRFLVLSICTGLALIPLSGCDSRPADGNHVETTIKPEVAKAQNNAYSDYQKTATKKKR